MGVVHLARDPQGSLVAIKVLRADATENVNARLRLAREVETMRRVRSPFVAEVLDADVTGEFPYIVTRYVPGPTLDEMVRSRGPLSGSGLRLLAYGTAEALIAIHAAGVVHRDLKPGNVMLTDDRPVVIDFGIAQTPDATRLTQAGLVMGTPGYLAPEVIEGRPSSAASDVHSWGATMAYAATGRAPFGGGGDSFQSVFYRIISGQADLSGVPGPLVPLLSAALDSDPARRPPARWLSAQASAMDMSAAGPVAASPRPTAVMTDAVPPGPGRSSRQGRKAARNAAAASPPPKQAAGDVAGLLPPVGSRPAPPPGAPQPAQGSQAPQSGQRPQPGQRPQSPQLTSGAPGPYGPQPFPEARSRSHHGRPGHHDHRHRADPDPPGGGPGRVAGRDHRGPGRRPGGQRAGRAPVRARAAGQ